MALLQSTQSTGTGANITSTLELAKITAPTGGMYVKASLKLSNLANGAANITASWREYQSDGVTVVRQRAGVIVAKVNTVDSYWGDEVPNSGGGVSGVYIPAGNQFAILVLSSNGSDTNATWVIDWINAAHCDVGAISGDSTAADNLEAMLDGTGGVGLTLNKLTIAANDATGGLVITNAQGAGVYVTGAVNGLDITGTSNAGISVQGGTAGIDASSAAGNYGLLLSAVTADVMLAGTGTIVNGTGTMLSHAAVAGVTASTLSTLTGSAAADAVWDEALSGHTGTGSAGKAMGYITGTPATAAATADAVWDEVSTDHVTAGTFGAKLGALNATAITVSSPVSSDETVSVQANRDYTTGDYALTWTVTDYDGPSLATQGTFAAANAVFVAMETADYNRNRSNASITKTFTVTGTTTLTISGTLSAADTASLSTSPPYDTPSHKYDLYLQTSAATPLKVPVVSGADLNIVKAVGA